MYDVTIPSLRRRNMPSTTILITISINVVSLTIGFIAFQLMNELDRSDKKQITDQMITSIINMILFIWLAKIILHLSIFISDPIAVLAYPSDANAFYLALILTSIQLVYKAKRNGLKLARLFYHFIPVLVFAGFTYHFIEIIWMDNSFAWGNFILMFMLLSLFLLLKRLINQKTMLLLISYCWVFGKLLISWLLPFTTIFGYMVAPLFLVMVALIISVLYLFNRKLVFL